MALALTYQSTGALLLGAARAPRPRRLGWLGEGGGLGVLHIALVQDCLRQLYERRLYVDVCLKLNKKCDSCSKLIVPKYINPNLYSVTNKYLIPFRVIKYI